MKKLRGSFAAKLIAVLLLCALAVVCVIGAAGTAYLSGMGAYNVALPEAEERALENAASDYLQQAGDAWQEGNTQPQFKNTAFRYAILSPEGDELLSSYEGGETRWEGETRLFPRFYVVEHTVAEIPEEVTPTPVPTPRPLPGEDPAPASPEPRTRNVIRVFCYDDGQEYDFASDVELIRWENERALTVKGYVLTEGGTTDEFSRELDRLHTLYGYRTLLPAAAGTSFLLGVLLFLFLLAAAGHRDESDAVTESFVDRIPLDLFTLLIAAGICLVCALGAGFGLPENVVGYAFALLLMVAAGLLFLLWCMSAAVRVKRGTLWQNCLITRLFRSLVRALKSGARLLARGLRALPLLWRWAAILGAILLLELLILWSGEDGGSVNWCIHAFVFTPLLLFLLWHMRRLRLGAKELAAGKLNSTIDTRGLYGEMKEHAEDLNHIREGINAAVNERMKSEHFKSELITNVSHDIKTPLTSIVNYVDLLAKEELPDEKTREYVAVLSRQSARLKKLLDDLIEASKASTGALTVVPERLDLAVLLDQCVGEYGERLGKAGLELVMLKPQEPLAVMADGRHMWRVFDNLLGNIVKYALPGTRVYLRLEREGDAACVSFRNISREALDRSAEELMERFVRGDDARSTEGSGLGLAIARSLTQLQGGEMELSVDGDLFKVVLRFPLAH